MSKEKPTGKKDMTAAQGTTGGYATGGPQGAPLVSREGGPVGPVEDRKDGKLMRIQFDRAASPEEITAQIEALLKGNQGNGQAAEEQPGE